MTLLTGFPETCLWVRSPSEWQLGSEWSWSVAKQNDGEGVEQTDVEADKTELNLREYNSFP